MYFSSDTKALYCVRMKKSTKSKKNYIYIHLIDFTCNTWARSFVHSAMWSSHLELRIIDNGPHHSYFMRTSSIIHALNNAVPLCMINLRTHTEFMVLFIHRRISKYFFILSNKLYFASVQIDKKCRDSCRKIQALLKRIINQ